MLKTLLLVLPLLLSAPAVAGYPEVTEEVKRDAQKLIQALGYRCDTVTDVTPLVWGTGYVVICNGWGGYEYHIKDRGGRVVVELK